VKQLQTNKPAKTGHTQKGDQKSDSLIKAPGTKLINERPSTKTQREAQNQ
jgi:hypothetical protein